jgi:hypothetical protein
LPGLKARPDAAGLPISPLNILEDRLFRYVLMGSYVGKNPIQSPDSEGRVLGNRDAVGCWLLGLENDVAAYLMDFLVFPVLAEVLDQIFSAQIAWEFHATATTSSRIR